VTELLELLPVLPLGEERALLERRVALVRDDVGFEVEDLLQILQRHVEQGADPRRQALQEPDVRDGGREVDVPHPLTAHLRLDDLDPALLADDAAVAHPLVLAAVALVVLRGAEDLRAEETVPFRLERAVVDRLRLLDLAVAPRADLVRRSQRDPDRVEGDRVLRLLEQTEQVFHDRASRRARGTLRVDERYASTASVSFAD
jgi:hypothetical protein